MLSTRNPVTSRKLQSLACKNVNRHFQGVPQSQAAANPWHQEEEKKDQHQRVQNKQMHEKHNDQLSLAQKRWSQFTE